MINPQNRLICPLDSAPLTRSGQSWRCEHGHTFDMAKQGYVNLLPVQHKRSKDPGDSKAMVQARQRFLARGYYQPLADQISEWVLADSPTSVLDAGCGEGYYLRQLVAEAERQQCSLAVAALDISKWAVQAAAKHDKRLTWLVASNSSIPLVDESVDCILCLFGFPVAHEFKRVLSDDGSLIMVDPAADHLQELKQIIYSEVKPKEPRLPIADDGFQLQQEQRLTFSVSIERQEDIHDLLVMTPHLYRSTEQGRQRAEALNELTVTVDVWLRRYQR